MISARPKTKITVLVVEDNTDELAEMTEALREHGLAVHGARNGAMALVQFYRYSPNYVLMDFWLPGTTGVVLATSMLGSAPDTRVILMSGDATFCNIATTQSTGAIAILKKPFPIDRIGEFFCKNESFQTKDGVLNDPEATVESQSYWNNYYQ